jgi:hypothetical protein
MQKSRKNGEKKKQRISSVTEEVPKIVQEKYKA